MVYSKQSAYKIQKIATKFEMLESFLWNINKMTVFVETYTHWWSSQDSNSNHHIHHSNFDILHGLSYDL